MSRQVTCHKPDNNDADRRIQGIGGTSNGGWYRKIDDAIRDVEADSRAYYVSVRGRSVWVIVGRHANGRKYLTTEGDGFPPNNLLNLPRCP
jgi:hypothetical protein